jgi:hypothetical protein
MIQVAYSQAPVALLPATPLETVTTQTHPSHYVPSTALRFSAVPNMTSDDKVTANDNMLELYTDRLVLRCPGH